MLRAPTWSMSAARDELDVARIEHLRHDGQAGGGAHLDEQAERLAPGPWSYTETSADLNAPRAGSSRRRRARRPPSRVSMSRFSTEQGPAIT